MTVSNHFEVEDFFKLKCGSWHLSIKSARWNFRDEPRLVAIIR